MNEDVQEMQEEVQGDGQARVREAYEKVPYSQGEEAESVRGRDALLDHDHNEEYCATCDEQEFAALQNHTPDDSVMQTNAAQEQVILKTMNALPMMAHERGKEYAKRISSKVAIDGTITFGIILPEGGRSDIGTVNPLIVQGFNLLNALSELLDVCDEAWEIMVPTAPRSTNHDSTEALSPADLKAYQAKVAAQADVQLRNEAKDMRHLYNTAPKIKYFSDREEYVNYNGFDVLIPANAEVLLPEPWYNILMESKNADRKRAIKASRMSNLEKGQLDSILNSSRNQAVD